MSSGATGDGGGGGRFSDDLEKLISRAGEKAGRGAKGQGSAVALPAEGEGAVATQGGGGEAAGEEEEDPKLSARAMKFRAMISKLRPQKKKIVVKVCKVPRQCEKNWKETVNVAIHLHHSLPFASISAVDVHARAVAYARLALLLRLRQFHDGYHPSQRRRPGG